MEKKSPAEPISVTNPSELSNESKTIITILLLIFFFPAGVILMWVWMKSWPIWLKILLTILPLIPIIMVIGVLFLIFQLVTHAPHSSYQYNSSKGMEAKIESTPTQNANWKTYQGDDFSFQYPKEYDTETNNALKITFVGDLNSKKHISVAISTDTNPTRLSPKEFINQVYTKSCRDDLKKQLVITTLIINNHNAAKYVGSCEAVVGHETGTIVFVDNGHGKVIELQASYPTSENEQLLSQILSTFKFITPKGVCSPDTQSCSDGSVVNRVAPNCDFAPCPTISPKSMK